MQLKAIFQYFFKSKPKDIDLIEDMFSRLEQRLEFRFKELSSQIQELELKLMTKDLKDKQQYGLLHYKLHETKKPTAAEDLELKLNQNHPKRKVSDH